ncbi:Phage major capsid protein [Hyphomicrobium sulfonivorans]|uniref:Phage major capsid protein n=1 Tax=Hyphomicrobium sulfonivorans TaxID=121290 RepID=A0A109BQK5_HYPSL|nr:phage major capsid protein [Hyphomicrobium sulfonivorans]KWT72377.1 Phage major capsid protein [Hyphomicrobium sulfonivorans]
MLHSTTARRGRTPLVVPGLLPGVARADAAPSLAEVKNIVEGVQTAFAAFKAQNDKEIAELKRGQSDVVTREHTDRINSELSALDKELKELNERMALANTARSSDNELTPDQAAYADAFRNWFAGGEGEQGLHALAVKAAMTTDSKPDGGFLVPTTVETAISRVAEARSVMRQLARVVSISTKSYTKLHNLGGAGSGWVGEKGARPQTRTPELSEIEIPTHELYANPAASQQLLDDARIDIAAWLAEEVNVEFAEQEGAAFFSGDGVVKPRGFLAEPIVANGSYAWGKLGYTPTGVAGALSDSTHNGADALIDLVHSLKPAYRSNARFLMNDLTVAKIRKLKDGDDNYLWQPSIQVGTPSSLLGYAVAEDDHAPDVDAGKFPVAFGDWQSGYTIVDRIGVRILRDPFSSKPYVLFYTTKRVGGKVTNFEAIKLLKVAAN